MTVPTLYLETSVWGSLVPRQPRDRTQVVQRRADPLARGKLVLDVDDVDGDGDLDILVSDLPASS